MSHYFILSMSTKDTKVSYTATRRSIPKVINDGTNGGNVRYRFSFPHMGVSGVLKSSKGIQESSQKGTKFIVFDNIGFDDSDDSDAFMEKIVEITKGRYNHNTSTFLHAMSSHLNAEKKEQWTPVFQDILTENDGKVSLSLFPGQWTKSYRFDREKVALTPIPISKLLNYPDMHYQVDASVRTFDAEFDVALRTVTIFPFINIVSITMIWTGKEKPVDLEAHADFLVKQEKKKKEMNLSKWLLAKGLTVGVGSQAKSGKRKQMSDEDGSDGAKTTEQLIVEKGE